MPLEVQHKTAVLLTADTAEDLVDQVNHRFVRDGFTDLAAAYCDDGKHYAILEVHGAPGAAYHSTYEGRAEARGG